jgi:hemoglobin/transferrin/lactoferrin receptor protein
MHHGAPLLTATLALLAASRSSAAQPAPPAEPASQEATVSAPSRREESLLDTPRAVSADSSASARRALARDVGERLDELPGVFVQRTTSASAAPLIRGLGGQRALLLFDGLRLSDSLTKVGGNALLTLIDPSIVQQVEVVRGPASVLYGSDALGGVVQVTPVDAYPRADGSFQWRGEAMARGASAERSMVTNGFVEGEVGRFGLVLGGSLGYTGQLVAGGDLGAQTYTGYGDRAASARATARLSERQRLGAAFHTSALTDAPRPDLSTPSDTRVFRLQQRDLAYLTWRYGGDSVWVTARAGAMVRTERRDRLREGRVDVERDQVVTGLASVQAHARYRDARFTAGAEATFDDVASSTDTARAGRPVESARGRYVGGSTYLSSGIYALYQQRIGARLLVEVGARVALVRTTAPVDGTAAAMNQTLVAPVASVGARYLVAEGVAVMVNGLSGFRAPNLDDFQALGSGARSFDTPNAALGAERSWTAEVGARIARDGWTGSAFLYGSRLTGLVVRIPSMFNGMAEVDGRRVYTRQNASDATMWGAELDLTYRARSGLYGSVAAMYTQGDATFPDDAGNRVTEPMAKVPPATGRAAAGWRNERGWVDAILTGGLPQPRLATSDREDVRLCPGGAAACTQADGWASLAVRGGLALTPSITVGAAVENVWNGAYTPYGSGYPAPGVNVVGMLRVRSR